MNGRMKNLVAVVTGGGSGYLGSAITRELDAAGAHTLCIDLPGKAESLVRQHGLQRTTPMSFGVSAVAELPGFVDRCAREHGEPDGFVHLAFTSYAGKRLEQLTAADFQHTLDAALVPAFVLSRAVAECMKRAAPAAWCCSPACTASSPSIRESASSLRYWV